MALDKTALAASFAAIFDGVSPETNGNIDPKKLRQKVATEMADVIDAYIKSATVTVASGIRVNTTGTATAQAGTTTTQGTGTIG